MFFSGNWYLCDDGTVRPVLVADALCGTGSWVKTRFLVDTAADRTVFSAESFRILQLQPIQTIDDLGLSGVGGLAKSVVVETQIRFEHGDSNKAVFKGQFAAFTDPATLDMSVLGRDILNLFAIIVDRQGDAVYLIRQEHYYVIAKR